MPDIRLSDLLGRRVVCQGQRIGVLSDVRFEVRPSAGDDQTPVARVYGLLISPKERTSYLGYERNGVNRPWPIAAFQRRRHRGTRLVLWSDVVSIGPEVELRSGYQEHDPALEVSQLHRG